MKARFANWLFNWLFANVVQVRRSDFMVGENPTPYLHRWYLLGSKQDPKHPNDPMRRVSRTFLGFRAYLHCFQHSDDDRALHDHPAHSFSISLSGSCAEHTIAAGGVHSRRALHAGDIAFRSAKFAHRIEIINGDYWTLFIFGPNIREWGFHCPQGWKHWKKFTAADNPGAIGAGCGE